MSPSKGLARAAGERGRATEPQPKLRVPLPAAIASSPMVEPDEMPSRARAQIPTAPCLGLTPRTSGSGRPHRAQRERPDGRVNGDGLRIGINGGRSQWRAATAVKVSGALRRSHFECADETSPLPPWEKPAGRPPTDDQIG